MFRDLGYEPDDLDVKVSELLVATADESDAAIDQAVPEVLKLLRDRMQMDVVFVAEFVEGRRVFRYVDASAERQLFGPGDSDPLEETWCQRVVDGRMPPRIQNALLDPASAALAAKLPFPIGTHLSAPIVLRDGGVYGTLCCFSYSPVDDPDPNDMKRLRYTAQMTAEKIDRRNAAAQH